MSLSAHMVTRFLGSKAYICYPRLAQHMLKRARAKDDGHFSLEGVLVSFFKKTNGVGRRRKFLPARVVAPRGVRAKTSMKRKVLKALALSVLFFVIAVGMLLIFLARVNRQPLTSGTRQLATVKVTVRSNRDLNFWTLGTMLAMAGDYIDGSTKKIFANDTKEGWSISSEKHPS